jgi:hypothetical protein
MWPATVGLWVSMRPRLLGALGPKREIRDDKNHAEAREVLRIHTEFSLDHFATTLTSKDQALADRRVALLRKAGAAGLG